MSIDLNVSSCACSKSSSRIGTYSPFSHSKALTISSSGTGFSSALQTFS